MSLLRSPLSPVPLLCSLSVQFFNSPTKLHCQLNAALSSPSVPLSCASRGSFGQGLGAVESVDRDHAVPLLDEKKTGRERFSLAGFRSFPSRRSES